MAGVVDEARDFILEVARRALVSVGEGEVEDVGDDKITIGNDGVGVFARIVDLVGREAELCERKLDDDIGRRCDDDGGGGREAV